MQIFPKLDMLHFKADKNTEYTSFSLFRFSESEHLNYQLK